MSRVERRVSSAEFCAKSQSSDRRTGESFILLRSVTRRSVRCSSAPLSPSRVPTHRCPATSPSAPAQMPSPRRPCCRGLSPPRPEPARSRPSALQPMPARLACRCGPEHTWLAPECSRNCRQIAGSKPGQLPQRAAQSCLIVRVRTVHITRPCRDGFITVNRFRRSPPSEQGESDCGAESDRRQNEPASLQKALTRLPRALWAPEFVRVGLRRVPP